MTTSNSTLEKASLGILNTNTLLAFLWEKAQEAGLSETELDWLTDGGEFSKVGLVNQSSVMENLAMMFEDTDESASNEMAMADLMHMLRNTTELYQGVSTISLGASKKLRELST